MVRPRALPNRVAPADHPPKRSSPQVGAGIGNRSFSMLKKHGSAMETDTAGALMADIVQNGALARPRSDQVKKFVAEWPCRSKGAIKHDRDFDPDFSQSGSPLQTDDRRGHAWAAHRNAPLRSPRCDPCGGHDRHHTDRPSPPKGSANQRLGEQVLTPFSEF
jgi:hypothetical protein